MKVHQTLLSILIGKSGLLEQSPIRRDTIAAGVTNSEGALIGPLIACVLRQIEGAVDSIAFALINIIPTRSECAKEQQKEIDGSLADSVDSYGGCFDGFPFPQ